MTSLANVGIIGCGNISGIYLKNAAALGLYRVAAVADIDLDRARARAEEYGVPIACSVDELLANPEVELVINLTIPAAHAAVALAALAAGKSVYNEKPLAVTREDGQRMLELARAKGLRVGGAPDTFLGGGIQTCRALIDEGAIGEPVAATGFMLCPGHESWHPSPEFYYQAGGGPLFDMGPYYLTALVALLGPVRRVTGSARITHAERMITSQPKRGQTIAVEVPTHIATVLDFAAGPVATLVTSFDVHASSPPPIEIYGTRGTLIVPDPNGFDGPVWLRRAGERDWSEASVTHTYTQNSRGLGVADMAAAIREGRPHRASGELTYHVLDLMHAAHDASREERHIHVASTCERPAAMPATGL